MNKKSIIFCILSGITGVLFLIALFLSSFFKLPVFIFSPVYNKMDISLHLKNVQANAALSHVMVQANDKFYTPLPEKNLLKTSLSKKINSLYILVDKNFVSEISAISVKNDIKVSHFDNLNKLKIKDSNFLYSGSYYYKYEIPKSTKYNKFSFSYNFHSVHNAIVVLFLSLFSGNASFFAGYFFLICTIIYYKKSGLKNPFFVTPTPQHIGTLAIFILGFLILSNRLFDYRWDDEQWTVFYSDPMSPFSVIFTDAGNPPVFYFLAKIYFSLFGKSTYALKILPFVIGVCAIILLWLFMKKKFDLKSANLAALLSFINLHFICFSQECRSYILQALITVVLTYLIFEIIETNKKSYYIFYAITGAIAANTHYYEIFLLISNFIFLSIYFAFKKRYFDILKFLASNIFCALSFLPFFVLVAKKGALDVPWFNSWIPDINLAQIKKCIFYLTGGIFSLILSVIFFMKSFCVVCAGGANKKDRAIVYTFSVIFLTILQALIFSYTIRPILHERYLFLLFPLLFIFLSLIFTNSYKNKYAVILFIIWILFVQSGLKENYYRESDKYKNFKLITLLEEKQFYPHLSCKNLRIEKV